MSGVVNYRPAPDRVAAMPAADRREICGQAIAFAAGARVANHHPIAADLLGPGVELPFADVVAALKLNGVAAAFTSNDLTSTITEGLHHIVLDRLRERGEPEHRALVRPIQVQDFTTQGIARHHPITVGPLDEFGEIEQTPVKLGFASLRVAPVGAIATFSRESTVNGDWGLLANVADELIDAAYRHERAATMALLESNPVLDDGVALFSEARGNDLTWESHLTALDAMSAALRKMGSQSTGGVLAGPGSALSLVGSVLAVPAEQEISAHVVRVAADLKIEIVGDPDLTSWYLLPRPTLRAVVGLAHLGRLTPTVDSARDFDSDNFAIRVRHDYGLGIVSPFAVRATPAAA